ncbi:hypothetical protein AS850_14550 [Frondihabitans sp. 762G35]|nr:hypothetical protein AS850_14550 [Frondihabitans sp. 762G35]
MPGPEHPAGTVVASHNPVTSKTEQDLRQRLIHAGLPLHPGRSALQCGFDEVSGTWPVLTPDFLVTGSRVCVEFDSGYTHAGEENTDRRRNHLLAGIGWTVVRLRTGGLPALGPYDVTTETTSFTVAAVAALVESVRDAVEGRPGRVRHVPKAAPTKRKTSRLGSIARHKRLENAFYASWALDSGETARLVIMADGHFLGGTGAGWGTPAFIVRLGLDRLDRTKWRGNLEELLSDLPDEALRPTSWFPWGDELFTGVHADDVHVDRTFNVGAQAHIGTLNLPSVTTWTAESVACADGGTLELHPEAVDAGWRFADLRQHTGRDGVFQKYLLMRDGPRRGLQAAGS